METPIKLCMKVQYNLHVVCVRNMITCFRTVINSAFIYNYTHLHIRAVLWNGKWKQISPDNRKSG